MGWVGPRFWGAVVLLADLMSIPFCRLGRTVLLALFLVVVVPVLLLVATAAAAAIFDPSGRPGAGYVLVILAFMLPVLAPVYGALLLLPLGVCLMRTPAVSDKVTLKQLADYLREAPVREEGLVDRTAVAPNAFSALVMVGYLELQPDCAWLLTAKGKAHRSRPD